MTEGRAALGRWWLQTQRATRREAAIATAVRAVLLGEEVTIASPTEEDAADFMREVRRRVERVQSGLGLTR